MPSVSKKDQARYDRIRDRMARARSRGPIVAVTDAEEDKVNSEEIAEGETKRARDVETS